MILLLLLLVVLALAHAKLYNVPPEADLAYVRKQLLVMTQEYVHGVPASGDAASGVCIPVGTNADDGRQRAYAHARHVFRHHGIAVDYESYREHLQRSGGGGKYDDRFCMSVADLPHMGRILQRGEI